MEGTLHTARNWVQLLTDFLDGWSPIFPTADYWLHPCGHGNFLPDHTNLIAFKDPPLFPLSVHIICGAGCPQVLGSKDTHMSWLSPLTSWPHSRQSGRIQISSHETHPQELWGGWIQELLGSPGRRGPTWGRSCLHGQAFLREEHKEGWKGRDSALMALPLRFWIQLPWGSARYESKDTLPLKPHPGRRWAPSQGRSPRCPCSICPTRHLHSYPALLRLRASNTVP